MAIKVTIDTTLETNDERRIKLIRHKPDYVFSRRFNSNDVKRWKAAADTLFMSDVEFVERVLNTVAEAVLKKDPK